ncbi:hypothetical protein [Streptomyces sp. NBC_00316]|uniref:hypothetical protein n=1 Tax=Streptomyces sp. NBC_00316 TaxID=2975710 RepID=UPI002E2B2D81|nr:hypothetical protein [Streptomyces sp. NBC_00316]
MCSAPIAPDPARTSRIPRPGNSGPYSDIDLAWTVPDDRFTACVAAAPEILGAARPVDSLRVDLDLQNSRKRRLLFVAFRGLPLVWRPPCPGYDQDNPVARGDDWSRPASAPAHAVAATEAVLRGQPQTAQGLPERGFRRIGAPDTVTGSWPEDIGRVVEAAAAREPGLRTLAGRADARAGEAMMDGCDLNRSPGKGWPKRLPRTPEG